MCTNRFLENDRLLLTTEVSVVPFRAAQDLDPDDEETVEEVRCAIRLCVLRLCD